MGGKYLLALIFVLKRKFSLTLNLIIPDNCLKPSQKKDAKLISHTENSQLEGEKSQNERKKEPSTQPGGINIKNREMLRSVMTPSLIFL